eukprot:scaffold7288_cov103-Isochrysis_galbana.AAC.1
MERSPSPALSSWSVRRAAPRRRTSTHCPFTMLASRRCEARRHARRLALAAAARSPRLGPLRCTLWPGRALPADAEPLASAGLERCVRLRSLDVSFNSLRAAEGLATLHDLRELKLYCNRLTSVGGLGALPSLATLLLQSNRLQPPDPASSSPAPSLSGLPCLSLVRIDNNPALGDAGVAALGLAALPKLTELDASGTGLTNTEALRGLAPTLETLRLDRNGLGRVAARRASASG